MWLLCCPLQSVMKNYDQNQDGYISLEDFEKIAANFPFSFCTHETDRWGSCKLSKASRVVVAAKLRKTWNNMSCWMVSKTLNWLTHCCVALWNIFCPEKDKSAVRKSTLTSWGECPYVPSWASTSKTRITSMKWRINVQRFVTHVEALWVSIVSMLSLIYLASQTAITCIVSALL